MMRVRKSGPLFATSPAPRGQATFSRVTLWPRLSNRLHQLLGEPLVLVPVGVVGAQLPVFGAVLNHRVGRREKLVGQGNDAFFLPRPLGQRL